MGGKLIVITGPDGCGKKTQTEFLVRRLKESNYRAETIDFPLKQISDKIWEKVQPILNS